MHHLPALLLFCWVGALENKTTQVQFISLYIYTYINWHTPLNVPAAKIDGSYGWALRLVTHDLLSNVFFGAESEKSCLCKYIHYVMLLHCQTILGLIPLWSTTTTVMSFMYLLIHALFNKNRIYPTICMYWRLMPTVLSLSMLTSMYWKIVQENGNGQYAGVSTALSAFIEKITCIRLDTSITSCIHPV
jgi:hypothetical protein